MTHKINQQTASAAPDVHLVLPYGGTACGQQQPATAAQVTCLDCLARGDLNQLQHDLDTSNNTIRVVASNRGGSTKENNMTHRLTPYDTGERLEPHPWVKSATVAMPGGLPRQTMDDDYGRVDFDDDEGRTIVTLSISRGPAGYVLHIEDLVDEALTVTGGTEAIVIGLQHHAGITELLSLAERGREDFLQQASHGDYTDEDQAAAATRWAGAQRAANAIQSRQSEASRTAENDTSAYEEIRR